MVEIREIQKSYGTGKNSHIALNNINLSFRENEFVAILGPSGSGKTTLLNVIGGLDHYDSGDLVIDHISTRGYSARDWDSYRNHSIGFIFQSYNLIQHQNILSNVEMALTISGISGNKRKEMAARVLEKVGLGDQLTKRPNQLSGGQMQRVAIARALVKCHAEGRSKQAHAGYDDGRNGCGKRCPHGLLLLRAADSLGLIAGGRQDRVIHSRA